MKSILFFHFHFYNSNVLQGKMEKGKKWDIKYNLNCLRSIPCLPFNLVFMDPPYNKDLIRPALCGLHAGSFLKKGACVIVEHSPPEQIPEDCSEYAIADQRRYGKTLVSFLDYML